MGRPRLKITKLCHYCHKSLVKKKWRKFCSSSCASKFGWNTNPMRLSLSGRFKKGHSPFPIPEATRKIAAKKMVATRRSRDNYIKSKETIEKGRMSLKRRYATGLTPWNKGKIWIERRGANNNRWKGGITPLIRQIRNCLEYRQWRSDVVTKDGWRCIFCGSNERLEVDHYPKTFSSIFDEYKISSMEEAINCTELWNINNGRTLCHKCHLKSFQYKNIKRYES